MFKVPEEEVVESVSQASEISPFGFKKITLPISTSQELNSKKKIMDELHLFIADIKISPSLLISDYWKVAKLRFPHLFKMYLQICGIPASGASVERFFSKLTLHSNGHKCNTKPEYLSNKCLISYNCGKFDF